MQDLPQAFFIRLFQQLLVIANLQTLVAVPTIVPVKAVQAPKVLHVMQPDVPEVLRLRRALGIVLVAVVLCVRVERLALIAETDFATTEKTRQPAREIARQAQALFVEMGFVLALKIRQPALPIVPAEEAEAVLVTLPSALLVPLISL